MPSGTIRQHDLDSRRTWRARLLTLLAIMGPGLIVMVGDNDAGGVLHLRPGRPRTSGSPLLWTLPLLIPVLVVNQEMVVRLGAVTGVGHARLINERFGKFWGAFSVGDLFILNFLTIATEFIGVSLALHYFGISQYLSVPIAAALLIAMTATGSFRRWERFMFRLHRGELPGHPPGVPQPPAGRPVLQGFRHPRSGGRVQLHLGPADHRPSWAPPSPPWQLFFQQSNIVDKRITPRWINYERADHGDRLPDHRVRRLHHDGRGGLGLDRHPPSTATSPTPAGWPPASSTTWAGRPAPSSPSSCSTPRSSGRPRSRWPPPTPSGTPSAPHHSLHRSWRDAKFFYGAFTGMVVLAAGIVIIPGAPLGLITTSVQALAGVLLPSATVFLLLLCNDKQVLGPWINRPWLNVLATGIVSILLMMSLILMVTTVFTTINVNKVAVVLGAVLVVVWAVGGILYARNLPAPAPPSRWCRCPRRATWRMPALNLLARPPVVEGSAGVDVPPPRLPGGGGPAAAGEGHPDRHPPLVPGCRGNPRPAPDRWVSLRRSTWLGEYLASMCPPAPGCPCLASGSEGTRSRVPSIHRQPPSASPPRPPGPDGLRIAFLVYRGNPRCGGQGVYTRHLTRELMELGHSVEVFAGQPLARGRRGRRLHPGSEPRPLPRPGPLPDPPGPASSGTPTRPRSPPSSSG